MYTKFICTQCHSLVGCRGIIDRERRYCVFCHAHDCNNFKYTGIIKCLCNSCQLLLEAKQTKPTPETYTIFHHYRGIEILKY